MELQRVTPESVGVRSQGILSFLKALKSRGLEAHSLMILRHGKVCAEGWWRPYGPRVAHPIFSFSKSFTSTAIGFAEQEGLLKLEERVVDIFPDLLPETVSDNLREMNLYHLLTMTCGHDTEEPSWDHPDWIRRFLAHPVLHKPGAHFLYNTQGTNLLAAVLYRKTGEHLLDYLRPRLLEPLVINGATCAKLSDGMFMGGGGFWVFNVYLARFMHLVLQKGLWEGKRLLNDRWFRCACTKQVENYGEKDWGRGYGFQFWQCTPWGVFRADGAFGQFGIAIPQKDAVVVITSAVEMMQKVLDCVWEFLLPAMDDGSLPGDDAAAARFRRKLSHLEIHPFPASCSGSNEALFQGKELIPEKPLCGFDQLIGIVGPGLVEFGGPLTSLGFSFGLGEMTLSVKQEGAEFSLPVGMDGHFRTTETPVGDYAAQGRWRSHGVLEIEVRRLGVSLSGARLLFRLAADGSMKLERDDILPCENSGSFSMEPVVLREAGRN